MTDSEKTRLLIEQSNVVGIREREVWEYVRLTPKQTGLSFDVYADNGGAYQHNNHKLWVYVVINSEKVPFTVEEQPSAVFFVGDINFDYEKLVLFIRKNRVLLKKLADGTIDNAVFFHLLKRVDECKKEEVGIICEMATLGKNESHLPTVIWLDDDRLYEPHAPRIKFRADFQNKDTHNDPSMEVMDPEKIHNLPSKVNLNKKQIEQIQSFVKINRDIIIKLANREINFDDFVAAMAIVDINGKTIETNIHFGKEINGFTKCEKGGKYNFIDSEGNYLFDDFCLDNTTDFISYVNGQVLAYVTVGDESFYINSKGKKEIF